MIKHRRKSGFTLIELIISIAVMGIIMIAFLNMFSTAIIGVYRAGDKGVAYNLAKDDIETRIARGEAITTNELNLTFTDGLGGTIDYQIEGGLVDTQQFVKNSESSIQAFVPLVPVVEISPKVNNEGAIKPFTIQLVGDKTHFSNSSTAQVLDKFGNVVINSIAVTATDTTHASFVLNSDFVNELSDYIIRVISPVTGKPNEVVRAKYSVYPPRLIAIGTDDIYVSDNGDYWLERSTSASFPSFSTMLGVVFSDDKIVAVGSQGNVLIHSGNLGWERVTVGGSEDLTDITWHQGSQSYYSSSTLGNIRKSTDGKNWTLISSFSGVQINGISATSTGKVVTVGSDGFIAISDVNGGSWQEISTSTSLDFNSVTSFDNGSLSYYVAVGENGLIYRSDDGLTWTPFSHSETRNIRSVGHHLGKFLAVGDDGLIMTSYDNGVSWTNNTVGTANYYSVAFLTGTNDVFVGGENIIMKSSDLTNWISNKVLTNETVRAFSGK